MIASGPGAAIDRLRQGLVLLSALAIAATMVLILCDVILRKLGAPVPGAYELVVNYLMPAAAFLPLAQVERDDQMITVEILGAIGGDTVQAFLGRFAAAVTTIVYVALAYTTLTDALNQMNVRSYVLTMDMRLPTWPAYFFLPVAFAAAALVAVQRIASRPSAKKQPSFAE